MQSREATYREITNWVRQRYGFVAQSCWIAHCKEINGVPVRSVYRGSRVKECPPNRRGAIEEAFRHFGMLP